MSMELDSSDSRGMALHKHEGHRTLEYLEP